MLFNISTLDGKFMSLGKFITSSNIYKEWLNWVVQKYTLLNAFISETGNYYKI